MVAGLAVVIGVLLPTTAAAQTGGETAGHPYVSGLISTAAPKSLEYPAAFLYDPQGRVVLLHGVNAVYKRKPYELYVDPGQPWNLDRQDASMIAGLGLNVVRLGILWQGVEPGTAAPNDPSICANGLAQDPGQWNQQIATQYLDRVEQTVDLLGRYHIYSLIDMHQDVYAQVFRGEGAPAWAVCTDGLPVNALKGRWSNNYGNPALDAAFANFWTNDVAGELQGEYDRAWKAVATVFADNPWVLGYDPINEPFTTVLSPTPTAAVDTYLECFYTGRDRPGIIDGQPADCPPDDPAQGVIPTIESVDPDHLIFREPTIYQSHGLPNQVGSIDYPNLVLNFHDYCSFRSGVTGNPYNLSACLSQEDRTFLLRIAERDAVVSAAQPGGLALFMSEFGATQSAALIEGVTRAANQAVVGWMYWSWKYYDDPTGSSSEALVGPDGRLRASAKAIDQTYPEAIAGSPGLIDFNPSNGSFYMKYTADPSVTAPTLVWVAKQYYYPQGYCAQVSGGHLVSAPDAQVLQVENPPTEAGVTITVNPGACPGH
jgi:endoglycosylceramidase